MLKREHLVFALMIAGLIAILFLTKAGIVPLPSECVYLEPQPLVGGLFKI